jgi:hypothetical protein
MRYVHSPLETGTLTSTTHLFGMTCMQLPSGRIGSKRLSFRGHSVHFVFRCRSAATGCWGGTYAPPGRTTERFDRTDVGLGCIHGYAHSHAASGDIGTRAGNNLAFLDQVVHRTPHRNSDVKCLAGVDLTLPFGPSTNLMASVLPVARSN